VREVERIHFAGDGGVRILVGAAEIVEGGHRHCIVVDLEEVVDLGELTELTGRIHHLENRLKCHTRSWVAGSLVCRMW
jgi:hypothetical protein